MRRGRWWMPTLVMFMSGSLGCSGRCSEPALEATSEAEPHVIEGGLGMQLARSPTSLPAPDGWLVSSEQDWVPVVNESGVKLQLARDAMARADFELAAAHLSNAASAIEEQARTQSAKVEQARLSAAAQRVRELGEEARSGKLGLEAFDAALASAYRESATVSWLYLDAEDWVPTFERPRQHFERALGMLSSGNSQAAASEVRRGAGFLRLAEASAWADDRGLLDAEVKKLYALASEADAEKLRRSALQAALVRADTAFARSYLRVAEEAYRSQRRRSSGRALRELASRLRTRALWLGDKSEQVPGGLAEQLERAGSTMAKGSPLAEDLFLRLVRRVREKLRGTPREKTDG